MTTRTKWILVFATIFAVIFYAAVVSATVWVLRSHSDKVDAIAREFKMADKAEAAYAAQQSRRAEQARYEDIAADCKITPGCVQGKSMMNNQVIVLVVIFVCVAIVSIAMDRRRAKRGSSP